MNLDDQLRSAAADVRSELGSTKPPPFEPPSPTGSRVALLALVALAIGGGWWLSTTSNDSNPVEIDLAAEDSGVEPPDATTSAADDRDPLAAIVAGVSTADAVANSSMDQPQRHPSSEDPDFGTTIRRLTDASIDAVVQPVDSATQAYNADGSLLLLYRTGQDSASKGHVVLDASTGDLITELDLEGRSDIENVSWDPFDPDTLIFQRGAELVDVDARTGEITFTAGFSGCTSIGNGSAAGSTISQTGIIGFLCELPDGTNQWLAFDRAEGRTIAGDLASINAAPFPSISGSFFAVVGTDRILILDEGLTEVRSVDIEASSFTMAQDRGGNDLVVATVFGGPTATGTIVTVQLATGRVDVVVGPETGYPYPPSGTQLSTAATDTPFRVAISTNNADETGVLVNEVMLLDLDGSNSTLSRLAHHRNDGAPVGAWPSTSMVALAPSGDRVLFSSNWGTKAIDTYEILLTG